MNLQGEGKRELDHAVVLMLNLVHCGLVSWPSFSLWENGGMLRIISASYSSEKTKQELEWRTQDLNTMKVPEFLHHIRNHY
jgi:hypothetical protein